MKYMKKVEVSSKEYFQYFKRGASGINDIGFAAVLETPLPIG